MRWVVRALALLVLLAVVMVTLPYIVRDQVVIWLRGQGVENARLKALELDWLHGDLRLLGLRAERTGYDPLNIDQLRLDLDYSALFDKQIRLQLINVEGLKSGYRDDGSQQWLGPLNLTELIPAESSSEEDADEQAPSEWSVGLDRLQLEQIDWRLTLPEQQHRLELDRLDLGAIYLWQPDLETTLELKGRVNGAPLTVASTATPLPKEKHARLTLQIEQLPVQSLTAAFLPSLKATLTTDMTLDLTLDGEQLQVQPQGQIAVREFAFQEGETAVSVGALDWNGQVSLLLDQFQPSRLEVDGSLSLSQGAALDQGEMALALSRLQWQGQNRFDLQADDQQLATTGALGLEGVLLNIDSLALAVGDLHWQGDVDLAMTAAEGVSLIDGQHQLTLSELSLQQGSALQVALSRATLGSDVRGEKLTRWQFANTQLDLAGVRLTQPQLALSLDQVTTTVEGTYDTAAAALSLQSPGASLSDADLQVAGAPLAAFNTLKLQPFHVALPLAVQLDGAQLRGLALARNDRGEPLLTLASTALDKLTMDGAQLGIDRVTLKELKTGLTLNEEMVPIDIEALQTQLEALSSAEQDASSTADSGDAMRVKIGQLLLDGDNRVQFTDRSTDPVFEAEVAVHSAQISGIDTGGEQQSQFSLEGEINQFAKLQAEGAVNLIGSPRSGHWNASLTGMELPGLSPYSMKYTGYFLKSGQLNLTLEGTLDKDILEGQNHIRLNRLDVNPVDQEQAAKFQQKISMPLGTAVAVLQDSDDNIDLDLPISGSLQDPEFDYQSIINRVLSKGLKQGVMSYLTKALQPYGALITLTQTAIKAGQNGAFISLEPIRFEPGGTELAGDAADYLDQLTQLLDERSALRLNLCGVTVEADRLLLQEALAEENEDADEPLEPEALAEALKGRLSELAENRSKTIKQQLQQRLAADRLFLCYPQIDQEGEPRVEASL